MRITVSEWLMLGVGVLIIGVLIFGTMYTSVTNKSNQMNSTINETNLPGNLPGGN